MPIRNDYDNDLLCSFCGKSQKKVKKLIAGPSVYICDNCIQLCNEIIAEEDGHESGGHKIKKKYYEKAWDEIVVGNIDKASWAKAFMEVNGDLERTKARYIAQRVVELTLQEEDRIRKEEEARLAEIRRSQKKKEEEDRIRKEEEARLAEIRRSQKEEESRKCKEEARKAELERQRESEIERDSPFIAYENGTVFDTLTNLMWAAKDNGCRINWRDVKPYCESHSGGGYTDWRMPTKDELAGLYDRGKSCKATQRNYNVYLTRLIELSTGWVWASKTRSCETANFCFTYGTRYWNPRSYHYYGRALPVRSVKQGI